MGGGALLVVSWVVGVPRLVGFWPSRLNYSDIAGLSPFRALDGAGTLSVASALTAGFDQSLAADPAQEARIAAVRADPCTALFGAVADPRLPIAFFSDFNCPNCRILNDVLMGYDAANPGTIRIVRHELPLLGAASVLASKAVLAADRQGGYAQMHARLMRARMVTDINYVMSMAEAAGLDGEQLRIDMQTPEIETAIERAKAIATVFGFYGTPGTVIGHTVFLGAIPAADVVQIIADERNLAPLSCTQG